MQKTGPLGLPSALRLEDDSSILALSLTKQRDQQLVDLYPAVPVVNTAMAGRTERSNVPWMINATIRQPSGVVRLKVWLSIARGEWRWELA